MAEFVKRILTDKPLQKLPDDILTEILLKLPIRSLLSIRSVSKQWLNLIKNPSFINLYTNYPTSNRISHNPVLILRNKSEPSTRNHRTYDGIVITLLSDDETLPYKDDLELNLLCTSPSGRGGILNLLGPCNGLFCITNRFDVVVFNPATKRCRKVPRSPLSPREDLRAFRSVVFGFDHVCNDYKVVRFNDLIYGNGDVEIFSLSTSLWTRFEKVVPARDMRDLNIHLNLFVNGAVHWLQLVPSNEDEFIFWYDTILVFDLNKVTFNNFELPEEIVGSWDLYLSVSNESLALIVGKYNDSGYIYAFDIWVMMEYGVSESWRKLYGPFLPMKIGIPMSLGEDGELLTRNRDGHLMSYNFETNVIKKLEVDSVSLMYAFRYKESFVSLK